MAILENFRNRVFKASEKQRIKYFWKMVMSSGNIFATLLHKMLITLALIFTVCHGMSQNKLVDKKISPVLLKEIRDGRIKGKTTFRITIAGNSVPRDLNKPAFAMEKILADKTLTVFNITGSFDELLKQLMKTDQVIFIESGSRIPKEEQQISRLDLSVNKINLVHRKYPVWKGEGLVVSVKEDKPDTTDIDFSGRYLTTHLSSSVLSSHASIMSTMIAGAGNSWHLGKGAAWGSRISSSDFKNLLPDPDASYQQYNITVQNHSYGVGVESYYGSDAAMYDISALNNKKLLHIFSSGNAGMSSPSTGKYKGLTDIANLTGSFKMAKNILSVGATDSFSVVEQLSSKGPAHDGRVKPELVAFGEDGSSGAAALVSGTSLILQEAYRDLFDSLPFNSLLKAILLNSADDVGNKEVDFSNGYGSLNAQNAVKTIQSGRFFSGSVTHGGEKIFTMYIPGGLEKCKVTLVWNDLPALPNAEKALVNDLDLEWVNDQTGNSWLPWVLNSFPHADSLSKPAERKKDSLNNVEQITIDNPVEGIYRIYVKGYNVQASQEFHLAFQFDSANVFEWEYPTAVDFMTAATSCTIRWHPVPASGLLEYSIDSGTSWQTIQTNLNLSEGFYQWETPSAISKALLRMTIGSSKFLSDTFTLASRTITGVGFNCPDSFLIYWEKLPGVIDYRVYTLGKADLEYFTTTSESQIVISKNASPTAYLAVAPLISGKEGMRSYTFDYTRQGVECYIRSFLGSLESNNVARFNLSLGTLYGIRAAVLEKQIGGRFVPLGAIQNPSSLLLSFADSTVVKGLNIYRVKLELSGEQMIYSMAETVYYLSDSRFIIYPNPVSQYQPVDILTSNDILQEVSLLVYDSYGRIILQRTLKNFNEKIPSNKFSKGVYFFRFRVEGANDTIMKLVVQ